VSLDEDYPKTFRRRSRQVEKLLEGVAGMTTTQREEIADAISSMADKAIDLDEIVNRLLNEKHTAAEIGELLIAFELTTEQIRGHSDTIDGKLYEIGDRLKGVTPTPSE
jgi:hypothetical protein